MARLLQCEQLRVKNSKIYKVAGLSLLGFVAVSIGVDRANVGPIASQVAGFCGAFAGALVAQARKRTGAGVEKDQIPESDAPETTPADAEKPPVLP
jgi:hypothetical protein